MTEVIEYKGKKWEVVTEPRDDMPTGKWIEIAPVPELPPEPPVGTILVDDEGLPWLKHGPYWCSIETGGWGIPWEELLRRSDLRRVVVVGKATDSVVRFNTSYLSPAEGSISGQYRYNGWSSDKAPVHGYFAKVVD